MPLSSYATTFTVPQSPAEVYAAVRDPRAWWNADIVGKMDEIGDEFVQEAPGLHRAVIRVVEAEPARRMVWHVVSSDMTFLRDKHEWVGTDLIFQIEPIDEGASLRFTHEGLLPDQECYDICENAWGGYMASLRSLITTGVGRPGEDSVADTVVNRENTTSG